MKSKTAAVKKERFCGNCRYHNAYSYPDQVFCFIKFQKKDNAVISVFDKCSQWQIWQQECLCLDDAIKNRKKAKQK